MSDTTNKNLTQESSLYVREHAKNPIKWYSWSEVPLKKALANDKLIFLSIGYSSCHWCHEMSSECFDNEEIAKILNENFISIIVDREEYIEIDRQYMLFIQFLTGYSGWPLNVFLIPSLKPFFIGTYFTLSDSVDKPGFLSVLNFLLCQWKENRQKIEKFANETLKSISEIYHSAKSHRLAFNNLNEGIILQDSFSSLSAGKISFEFREILSKAFKSFVDDFDDIYGGFGSPPKFLNVPILKFLLDFHFVDFLFQDFMRSFSLEDMNFQQLSELAFQNEIPIPSIESTEKNRHEKLKQTITNDLLLRLCASKKALAMVTLSVDKMIQGGIYDQVGYGFHRYSVDKLFHLPHFEKMLYDQAQMIVILIELYVATRNEIYLKKVSEILNFCEGTFLDNEKTFMFSSSLDSDSLISDDHSVNSTTSKHSEEGAYYVWDHNELTIIIDNDDFAIFCFIYDVHVDQPLQEEQSYICNFLKDKCVLRKVHCVEEAAEYFSISPLIIEASINRSLEKLREARRLTKIMPLVDDKKIVSWNALMISACAKVYFISRDKKYLQIAVSTAEFIFRNLFDQESGTLLRYYPGKVSAISYDYVCMIAACLDLYQVTFDDQWIMLGLALQKTIDEFFTDENGDIFGTLNLLHPSFIRLVDDYDGAEASATSLNLLNLLKWSKILFDSSFEDRALTILHKKRTELKLNPKSYSTTLSALTILINSPILILFFGHLKGCEFQKIIAFLTKKFFNFSNFLLVGVDDSNLDGYLLNCNQFLKDWIQERTKSSHCTNDCLSNSQRSTAIYVKIYYRYKSYECEGNIEALNCVLGKLFKQPR